jgi:two-component system, chemotaxis family, protein-glutamate methylesterase/glutaminase
MNTLPIRVLVVEDSQVARELLVSVLQNSPGFEVVGTAQNGMEAVRLARRLKPSVITMDVYMPELDGLAATQQIMAETPCPIVIISACSNNQELNLTFSAIQAGALTVLDKPGLDDAPEVLQAMVERIRLMSEVKVVRRWSRPGPPATGGQQRSFPPGNTPARPMEKIELIAMAASTGGPAALVEILSRLPADFSIPIVIVQHITPGFGSSLVTWLNQMTPLEVRLAQSAETPRPGQALIAPDDYHLEITPLKMLKISQTPPDQNGQRPSANYLFHSVARNYGARAMGIILTGMGNDGAEGLLAMRQSGAYTLAQNQESCVVFGMPAVAIGLGAVDQILPVDKIATTMIAFTMAERS